MTSNSISYNEKIRSWKISSSSALSSSDYTYDMLLHQPYLCNNNDRARLNMPYQLNKTNYPCVRN